MRLLELFILKFIFMQYHLKLTSTPLTVCYLILIINAMSLVRHWRRQEFSLGGDT